MANGFTLRAEPYKKEGMQCLWFQFVEPAHSIGSITSNQPGTGAEIETMLPFNLNQNPPHFPKNRYKK
jgi:hypothetical protein